MIQTYIKNSGITKTILHDNNKNKTNEIKWDTDYDGNIANISLDLKNNGSHKNYTFSLDNNDLANILNTHSVNIPLDKRLKNDFKKPPIIYQIELDNNTPNNEINESILESLDSLDSINNQLNYALE